MNLKPPPSSVCSFGFSRNSSCNWSIRPFSGSLSVFGLSKKTNLLKCCLAYLSSSTSRAEQSIWWWWWWWWCSRGSSKQQQEMRSQQNVKHPSYARWARWGRWAISAATFGDVLSPSSQWHSLMENKWAELNSCTFRCYLPHSLSLSVSLSVSLFSFGYTWLWSRANCKWNVLCCFILSFLSARKASLALCAR